MQHRARGIGSPEPRACALRCAGPVVLLRLAPGGSQTASAQHCVKEGVALYSPGLRAPLRRPRGGAPACSQLRQPGSVRAGLCGRRVGSLFLKAGVGQRVCSAV
eukprot:1767166-Alexandrium_andersonii.AAC.1